MKYKNIFVVGTSHIAKESVEEVKNFIANQRPDIVAVELDRSRLAALTSKRKQKFSFYGLRRVGINGFLFSLLGSWVERKLGEKVGVSPGSEMLSAVNLANQYGAQIALIDQDIEITLKRFSKAFTFKEKWRLFVDVIKGLIFRKAMVSFDLNSVPNAKLIAKLINEVKIRYPNLYAVLVTERNVVMAKRLAKLSADFPNKRILAVVGAGHEAELLLLIKKYLNSKFNILSDVV